jgi:hypothetical protein
VSSTPSWRLRPVFAKLWGPLSSPWEHPGFGGTSLVHVSQKFGASGTESDALPTESDAYPIGSDAFPIESDTHLAESYGFS